jgi:hypothetical protein
MEIEAISESVKKIRNAIEGGIIPTRGIVADNILLIESNLESLRTQLAKSEQVIEQLRRDLTWHKNQLKQAKGE